jgi:hypothetical protein
MLLIRHYAAGLSFSLCRRARAPLFTLMPRLYFTSAALFSIADILMPMPSAFIDAIFAARAPLPASAITPPIRHYAPLPPLMPFSIIADEPFSMICHYAAAATPPRHCAFTMDSATPRRADAMPPAFFVCRRQ